MASGKRALLYMRLWRLCALVYLDQRQWAIVRSVSTPMRACEFVSGAEMRSHIGRWGRGCESTLGRPYRSIFKSRRQQSDDTPIAPDPCYHMVHNPKQCKHHTEVRKLSRHKREARVSAGELDCELDFICPSCNGVYSLYNRHDQLHLRACKRRITQTVKIPSKPLPSPPPFESEVFPTPAAVGPVRRVQQGHDLDQALLRWIAQNLGISKPEVRSAWGRSTTSLIQNSRQSGSFPLAGLDARSSVRSGSEKNAKCSKAYLLLSAIPSFPFDPRGCIPKVVERLQSGE